MAFALPLFELSSGVRSLGSACLQSIGCVIKFPSFLYFFFAPADSLAFNLNRKLLSALPGPVDLIKSIRKAIFCFSAIFWVPFLGFIDPKRNLNAHYSAGFQLMLELPDPKKTSKENPKATLKWL